MANIIVAVNAIFVVRLDQREAFLSAFQNQLRLQRPQHHDHNHLPLLVQAELGEDLETLATFHGHFKFHCSSVKAAKDAMKEHSVFLNGPCDIWRDLESADPFLEPPKVGVWTVAESTLTIPNPKRHPKDKPFFCLNADLHILPEHREELLRVLENARSNSIREPLCIEYQYGESIGSPNTFHVHQQYMGDNYGKEGFDAHVNTPYYQVWKEFARKEPFLRQPVGFPFRALVQATQINNPHFTLFLDGGIGHELKQRDVSDGSFLPGFLANERQPAFVQACAQGLLQQWLPDYHLQ